MLLKLQIINWYPSPTTPAKMQCKQQQKLLTYVQRKPVINYQLPNGLIKVRRRWGQRHPQGANSGSNGILNSCQTQNMRLPPAHSP
jgi:hypothetical protein